MRKIVASIFAANYFSIWNIRPKCNLHKLLDFLSGTNEAKLFKGKTLTSALFNVLLLAFFYSGLKMEINPFDSIVS